MNRPPKPALRVIDLGIITAGASTSAILADLGGDVIKVESASYMDPFRQWDMDHGKPRWWDDSALYKFTNRNKRCVSIDLKMQAGRDIVLELVRQADVVVENFRRGVMPKLGLGYDTLRAVNPRIVLASVSSQGEEGPERDAVSFGSTLDATSGLASLTGYPDSDPVISGRDVNYPDQVVSVFAAGMILAAVAHARATGDGGHLDLPQRELASFLIGEEIVASAHSGKNVQRKGNASAEILWQDCLKARDAWIAITLSGRDEAGRVATAINAGTATTPGEVAAALARWVSERSADDAVSTLLAAGVPVARVRDAQSFASAPFEEFGWALARDPEGGIAKGFPFQQRGHPLRVHNCAPALGEHTREVLAEILGMGPDEIRRLDREGVTSASPD